MLDSNPEPLRHRRSAAPLPIPAKL